MKQNVSSENSNPSRVSQATPVKGEWAVLVTAGNLLLVSNYATTAIERLKQIVPAGARRFNRRVGSEFLSAYGLNQTQTEWLTDSRLFNGSWQLLPDYKRPILEALTLDYAEVWVVEQGRAERLASRPSAIQPPIDPVRFALEGSVAVPLVWAKSYSLYCHRHRQFEVTPCKDAGVLTEVPKVPPAAPKPTSTSASTLTLTLTKEGRKASFLLKAPKHTLIRARRQQVSYYLAGDGEVIRLGRDDAGASVAQVVIESQRLGLVLRAARQLHSQDVFQAETELSSQ